MHLLHYSILRSGLALAVMSFLMTFGASAQTVISVNFTTNGLVSETSLDSGDLAGFEPAANWNNTDGSNNSSITTAVYDDGTSVGGGFTVSWTSGTTWRESSSAFTDPDQQMFNGYLDIAPDLTITNIPFATYDVYVYVTSDSAGRQGGVTADGDDIDSATFYYTTFNGGFNGGTFVVSTKTDTVDPIPSANVLRFAGLTETGTLTLDGFSVAGSSGISGIQIVQVTVPEPASGALLLGAGTLLALRRRKRA